MEIDRNAPAIASAESLFRARIGLVWSLLTDIDGWTRWNPDVSRAELRGPLAPGSVFRCKAAGAPIVSTIQEVIPQRRLVWTGRFLGIRAIHAWSFEERPDGVLSRTEESFDGPLVRLLRVPLRSILGSAVQRGLEALQAECERRAAGRAP
jgi:uncharacterized protein YndB with AHSA1/START domain